MRMRRAALAAYLVAACCCAIAIRLIVKSLVGFDPVRDVSVRHAISAEFHRGAVRVALTSTLCGDSCVFRVYLEGPTRMGRYLRYRDDAYVASLPAREPGEYRLLVLLESFRNLTETVDGDYFSAAVCGEKFKYVCMGKRVSDENATVSVPNSTTSFTAYMEHAGVTNRKELPRCRYDHGASHQDSFEWVPRRTLLQRGFSSLDAPLIPDRLMPPNDGGKSKERLMQEYFANRTDLVQPFQEYVWFPRACRQPWIEATEMRSLAESRDGKALTLALLGTSRIFDTANLMRDYLNVTHEDDSNSSAQLNVLYHPIELKGTDITLLMGALNRTFESEKFCMDETNATSYAFAVSRGIWESAFHNMIGTIGEKKVFRFDDNARATIDFIRERCRGYDYRIVVMTNPVTHLFDERSGDPYKTEYGPRVTVRNYVDGTNNPLRNAGIDVANRAWRKAASDYNLSVVDGESMSFARYEDVRDSTHYLLGRNPRVGNEVTATFLLYLLAAVLESFE